MKRTLILVALLVGSALPALAQSSTEFGVLVGGSRRFVKGGPERLAGDFIESNFAFGNNAVDLWWSMEIEDDVRFKIRAGRIQTQIATPYEAEVEDDEGELVTRTFRRDFEGEVTHLEAIIEYRFDEPWGSSGLFGGAGFYRQSPDEGDSSNGYGFVAGVNADFPITRRYGAVLEAAYHWTKADFEPRYMTVGAGMRVRF